MKTRPATSRPADLFRGKRSAWTPATPTTPAGLFKRRRAAWRPPPRLSLSQWADRYFYLSPESAAEPGRWKSYAYQRGIMDAITDPRVRQVTWKKAARTGATKIMDATVGYFMHQDPCPIMVVQPTVEDAEGYSKEEIAPMLRDCEALRGLVKDTVKKSAQTILHKRFPGGSLSMVGANSGRGFRRVTRRVVIFDEVDGYPPSAGAEGDQIKLGIRRTETFWNRKIIAASTPLVAGASRIEQLFEQGDQRRFYVPCPHCGHGDILVFREGARGHFMQWPEGKPEEAYFVCKANGCIIEDKDKRAIFERGEWRADAPFNGHASFHLWTAYSYSPNASWGQIACEFVEAVAGGPEKLKTFVNTVLGETWVEKGEAPEWERIRDRAEDYPIGTVPAGVLVVTAGVDVQKDRLVWGVDGWGAGRENWLIDAGEIMGDTARPEVWAKLDELLNRTFPGADDREWPIALMGVDSGYNTQQVYNWCRRHPMSRVIATKGVSTQRTLVGVPSAVDVSHNGKKRRRGYKVWPLGVDIAKAEFYAWLRLTREQAEAFPPGWCHFPKLPDEYFRQITAEQLVTIVKRNGFTRLEWQLIPNRQNHWLDCRVISRAAAAVLGIDRMTPAPPRPPKQRAATPADLEQPTASAPRAPWLKGGRPRDPRSGGGWLRRR